MDKKKYSIVCYLGGELHDKVRAMQRELFALTGSRECLDSWEPHFTLGDGIWVDEEGFENAKKAFEEISAGQKKFEVEMKGFGGRTDRTVGDGEITTPFVLWIDVLQNSELLELVERIKESITSKTELWYRMPQPYMPHVTVAFRDLSEDGYLKGSEFLKDKNIQEIITVDHIALVEHLPEKDIETVRFQFAG